MAVDRENRLLYVADTWNRRVSVFDLEGNPQFTFDVRGWYEDLGNRPYMAIDQTRNLLYVGDPDAGRVLVYDLTGNCVGSFGQPSDVPVDNTQFDTIGGLATDAEGNVYVSDSSAGRVLKFAPFVDTVMPAPNQAELDSVLPEEFANETVEVLPPDDLQEQPAEATVELTAETTPEAPVG
jgi:sugar lactone lactonase YvrE